MTLATDDRRSANPRRRMTLKEFLTYDDGTETRYELVDGVLVEMGTESTSNVQITMLLIYQFVTFRGDESLTSGRSETIVSPTFPELHLTALDILGADD